MASAFARIPPVTSATPSVGRSDSRTAGVRRATGRRRGPGSPGVKTPSTSLTKTNRREGKWRTSSTAIVSADRIEKSHASSGTTSPKATGIPPQASARRNGSRSSWTSFPARLTETAWGGTENGDSPASTSACRTAACNRRTSALTIAAPRTRCARSDGSPGAWARFQRTAPGCPKDPAPWSRTTGGPPGSASSSARRWRILGRRRASSLFRVSTLPPSFTTTGSSSGILSTQPDPGH